MKKLLFITASALLMVVLTGCPNVDSPDTVDTDWYTDNPTGTSFFISTPAQLAGLAWLVNDKIDFNGRTINLAADIDLSSYNSGKGWIPIGNENDWFSGNFDGRGKTISNLYINNSDTNCAGLFGVVMRGSIKNLRVVVSSGGITGKQLAGGIACGAVNSLIENCSVTGGKIESKEIAGGIVGTIQNGTNVFNCYTTVAVSAVAVSGPATVGGVVGGSFGACWVTNCYATGAISGSNHVGGLVGIVVEGGIYHCVALNSGITGGDSKGRVVGAKDDISILYENYALSTIPGSWGEVGLAKIEGADIMDVDTKNETFYKDVLNWDLTNVWTIQPGQYPTLR